jgi:hypothetical protein
MSDIPLHERVAERRPTMFRGDPFRVDPMKDSL